MVCLPDNRCQGVVMNKQRMFFALLVALSAGCTAQVPAGPDGTHPATMPVMREPAPATTSTLVKARSLCAPAETILFSCETQAGKTVSLCASQPVSTDQGHLYYAYGSPGHPELVFPSERRPPTDFKRTHLTFAGSTGGYAYSFENADYRYIVYSISGAENLEEQGLLITRGNKRKAISAQQCRNGSVVEDDNTELLDLTLTWPVDRDLDEHGLPTRK
jgi:hypothetical protein